MERNKVKTYHLLAINGYNFQVLGYHEYAFKNNSVMSFDLFLLRDNGNHSGRKYIKSSDLRKIAAELVADDIESKKRAIYNKRFEGMSLLEVMAHVDFRYGRVNVSEALGNYVNIYCENKYSPTGVTLVMGCSEIEFDAAAKATNNSHNYLVGSEGRRIVHN